MRGVFVLGLMLGILSAVGQDFRQRLTAMQKEYATMDAVHVMMAIEVYESEKSKMPYFTEIADVKRQSYNYAYTLGATSMLMNKCCLIMVDKNARQILYAKRSLEKEKQLFKDPFKVNLDSILSLYGEASFLGRGQYGEQFRIHLEKGEIKQMDIFINGDENVLTRMEYRYNDMHYVVVRFPRFDKKPVFEPGIFSDANYVIEAGGALKAAGAFIGYHVAVVDGIN